MVSFLPFGHVNCKTGLNEEIRPSMFSKPLSYNRKEANRKKFHQKHILVKLYDCLLLEQY